MVYLYRLRLGERDRERARFGEPGDRESRRFLSFVPELRCPLLDDDVVVVVVPLDRFLDRDRDLDREFRR